jgi:hypothetical protein
LITPTARWSVEVLSLIGDILMVTVVAAPMPPVRALE